MGYVEAKGNNFQDNQKGHKVGGNGTNRRLQKENCASERAFRPLPKTMAQKRRGFREKFRVKNKVGWWSRLIKDVAVETTQIAKERHRQFQPPAVGGVKEKTLGGENQITR